MFEVLLRSLLHFAKVKRKKWPMCTCVFVCVTMCMCMCVTVVSV